mgnify:CR=1 FL=1
MNNHWLWQKLKKELMDHFRGRAYINAKLLEVEFRSVLRQMLGRDTYRLFPMIGETNGIFWLNGIGEI